MVLKIKRECGLENTPEIIARQKWWIFDDIRKISISDPIEVPPEPFGAEFDVVLRVGAKFDVLLLDRIGKGLQGKDFYTLLVCKRTGGDEFSVAFDTIAYLCNDNGQTIEKIVGGKQTYSI